ncbi:hypothetical protein B0H13DRAFT_1609434 [Mycena leptocephala]|nr:hypothetical protein B0H13DRAFT_1609434 [Mycena leptocephala]
MRVTHLGSACLALCPQCYPKDGFSFLDSMVASITDNSPANWNYGAYLSCIDNRLANNMSSAKLYYGMHYERLVSLKSVLDPRDTFRFPVGVA